MDRASLIAIPLSLALAGPAVAEEKVVYSYDALGRLIGTAHTGSLNDGLATTYTYDRASNRETVVVTGAPAPPVEDSAVTFAVKNAKGTEGDAISAAIVKSSRSMGTITVDYATVARTAKEGIDYESTSGTLSFAPNEMTKYVNIRTIDNATDEANRTFDLYVTAVSSGAGTSDSRGVVTIVDDD